MASRWMASRWNPKASRLRRADRLGVALTGTR